jgi:hypothetical protein
MINIDQTKFYRIQNQVSGKYLLAGSWGKSTSDKLVWQYTLNQENTNSYYDLDGFLWQIVPDGNGYCRIINKVSGFQLLAGSWGKVSTDKAVWQYALTDSNTNSLYDPDGFLWRIDDQGNIINKVSGMYLLAGSWGNNLSDNYVWQYALNDGLPNSNFNANGFHWSLLPFSEVPTKTIYVSRNGQSNNIKLRDSENHTGQSDNNGNLDDITTSANYGNAVIWEIDPNDSPASIYSLNGISKKGNSPADLLVSHPVAYNGQYQATIARDPSLNNKIETYNISYQIDSSGPVLERDPKLKLDPLS